MIQPDISNPCPGLTVEQKWEQVKQHAPEAWEFYERVTTGDLNGWWQDKPLQLFIRAILYIGQLKAEYASAYAEGEKAGMERAAVMLRIKREVIEATYSMDDESVFRVQQFAVSSLLDVEAAIRAAKETKE